MALQIVSTNIVGAGLAVEIATAGEDLFLLSGVLIGSTTSFGIYSSTFDVSLRIDGTIAAWQAVYGLGSSGQTRLLVGETGVLFSTNSFSYSFGVSLRGGSNDVINHGEISSPEAISLYMSGGNNEFQNFGTCSGVTGLQLGLGSNDVVYNAGLISGSGSFDDTRDAYEGTGIYVQSSNSTIINAVGGRIITTALGGPAITGGGDAGGLSVQNRGEISSVLGTGIDLTLVALGQSFIGVTNEGLISGGTQAYVGSVNTDTLVNRGMMSGDVQMGVGNDTLDNRGGTIEGDVLLGDGTDLLDNRSGTISGNIEGGAGSDIFRMGAGIEVINGGSGFDTIDFRGTPAVVVALDGSLPGMGNAAGDEYLWIEFVNGSNFADVIVGSTAANTLRGYGGNDTINGGAGIDKIAGGRGVDALTGGAGNDVFLFDALTELGDVITDFGSSTSNHDVFNIRGSAFGGGLVAGTLAAADFVARADNVAQDATDRFIFRTSDRSLWFDADGSGAGAAVMLADLQTSAVVNRFDIVIF